ADRAEPPSGQGHVPGRSHLAATALDHTRRCKCVPARNNDCSEWVTVLPLVALKLPSIDQLWSPRPTAGSLSAGVRLPTRQPRHTGSLHGAPHLEYADTCITDDTHAAGPRDSSSRT